MTKVSVSKQSNYPVSTAKVKKRLSSFLEKQGIVSKAEVSVAIVGEKKMIEIVKKYLKDGKLHNVLSFTPTESGFTPKKVNFVYPPDDIIHLGEIIVCYSVALSEAKMEEVLIDDKVCELVEHGALHLLGIHHEV